MREARELQTLIDQLEAYIREQDEAIKALQKTNEYLVEQLRQALAQPEQEPVCDKDPSLCGFTFCQLAKVCKHTPRNTMPTKIFAPNLEQILNAAGFYRREWVGLTDDDCIEAQKNSWNEYKNGKELKFDGFKLCKNIEQLLKDKNT